jgi:hypothetical protein
MCAARSQTGRGQRCHLQQQGSDTKAQGEAESFNSQQAVRK